MNISVISVILRALLKWWWLIVICVAMGVGAGYFLRNNQPDIYASTATVLVGRDPRQGEATWNVVELLEAYSIFIRRSTVLEPVIESLNLGVRPEDLAGSISTSTNPFASLLEISVFDGQPERAALIANAVAQELINQSSTTGASQDQEFVQSQLRDLEAQISNLQEENARLISAAANLTSAFDIDQNVAQRQQNEATIQQLRTLYANLGASLGERQSLIRFFELAVPNYYPIASSGSLELIAAGGAGGVLAILTIVLITFFDDRLQWEDREGDALQGVKVLGPLGIIPRNKLPLYVDTMPNAVEVQAARQVRDKILLSAEPRPRVISFVSYDSGDGKTLTSSNLALTFSKSGLRTVAIDLDMRRGDLHEVFRLPNVYGISDVVAAREPLEDLIPNVLLDSGYENLSLITSGRSNTDPAALLSRSRFPQLIYLLKKQFDIIIMDSAPTIAGADPVFLAEVSDGVVIVVSARRTTMTGFRRTITALSEAQDAKILGVVFNRVRLQITSKYSNTYYQQVPSLGPAQLSKEFLKPASSPLNLRARAIQNAQGERLLSLPAAATYLGVKEKTVREWTRTGYLKTERRLFRRWVKEDEIQKLTRQFAANEAKKAEKEFEQTPAPVAAATAQTGSLPNQLREQRAALLDFVNNPNPPNSDNNSNSYS